MSSVLQLHSFRVYLTTGESIDTVVEGYDHVSKMRDMSWMGFQADNVHGRACWYPGNLIHHIEHLESSASERSHAS